MKFGVWEFEGKYVKLLELYLDVANVTNTLYDDVHRCISLFRAKFPKCVSERNVFPYNTMEEKKQKFYIKYTAYVFYTVFEIFNQKIMLSVYFQT